MAPERGLDRRLVVALQEQSAPDLAGPQAQGAVGRRDSGEIVPLRARDFEGVAKYAVAQELLADRRGEVAAHVEAEADLRAPGDGAREVTGADVAQDALAQGLRPGAHGKVEGQRDH